MRSMIIFPLTMLMMCFSGGLYAEAERPNIVLIMADDLGYGHIGSFGQEKIRTPHLDQMAEEGLRFTQFYAGSPKCAPSRSVLMTGLHAGHTPVRGNSGGIPLRKEDRTFAQILQEAGYRTGLFGKWGLGDAATTGAPRKKGFDEFFGYLHQKHAHYYYANYLWYNEEKYIIPENRNGQRGVYTHDVIVEKGLEFLEAEKDNPFFAFFSFTIPHHEWTAPDGTLKEYAGVFEEEVPEHTWREGYALPDAPRANMAAMITHMDKGIGEIMAKLKALGIDDNTLVIFTSDNGADAYSIASPEFFRANGDLRGYKYDFYEGGIRVPTIARWPATIQTAKDCVTPLYFADFLPTFAALAGKKKSISKETDGISFAPTLLGEPEQEQHDFMYWGSEEGQWAGRMGNFKMVQQGDMTGPELYDLSNDTGESNDIAQKHPEIVKKMRALLGKNHDPAPPQIEPDAPDGRYYR